MGNLVKLGKGGRVVIPASLRRQMGVTVGDELVFRCRDGHLEILPARQAVLAAQELVKRYTGGKRNLAQELIVERRQDAKNVTPSRRGQGLLQAMRGKATTRLGTEKIMVLTRKT
jgi:AbrB family looped-hinge helix DNA binding protein